MLPKALLPVSRTFSVQSPCSPALPWVSDCCGSHAACGNSVVDNSSVEVVLLSSLLQSEIKIWRLQHLPAFIDYIPVRTILNPHKPAFLVHADMDIYGPNNKYHNITQISQIPFCDTSRDGPVPFWVQLVKKQPLESMSGCMPKPKTRLSSW